MDTPTDERGLSNSIYEGRATIRTHTGTFDLDNPTFNMEDIAHGLAQIPRYNGQSNFPYSVARHSINVARLMLLETGGDPREGLMHDGTEAYLSDVPAPFKPKLPDWRAVDAEVDTAMRLHFDIGPKTPECKTADFLALFIEAYYLIPGRGEDFLDPQGLRTRALEILRVHRDFEPIENDWQLDKGAFLFAANHYGIIGA
jgi:hypothetical protein